MAAIMEVPVSSSPHPIQDAMCGVLYEMQRAFVYSDIEKRVHSLIKCMQSPDLKNYKLDHFVDILTNDLEKYQANENNILRKRIEFIAKTIQEKVPEAIFPESKMKEMFAREASMTKVKCDDQRDLKEAIKDKPYFFAEALEAYPVIRSFPKNYWLLTEIEGALTLLKSIKSRDISYSNYPVTFLNGKMYVDGYAHKSFDSFFKIKDAKIINKYAGEKSWEALPYFQNLDKQGADLFLKDKPEYTFILRPSSIVGCFTISVRLPEKTHNQVIFPQEDKFFFGGKIYDSLESLIHKLKERKGWVPYIS